jgi:hypothetical protein
MVKVSSIQERYLATVGKPPTSAEATLLRLRLVVVLTFNTLNF